MDQRRFDVSGLKPLMVSIPHSGERIPDETPWLKGLPETLLMFDVDRYVDLLYEPVISRLEIPRIATEWHRYACDLNRLADDVDCDSVEGHVNPSGKFSRGLHWAITTDGTKLMPKPMSPETHKAIVANYFDPFHAEVRSCFKAFKAQGWRTVYHLDLHSMPSVGTKEHQDPGNRRADVVISDFHGASCSSRFKELAMSAYERAGFKVAYNWPYFGGRVTQTYGKPSEGQETLQVEFNRAIYMNESTKLLSRDRLAEVQHKLSLAIEAIHAGLPS